MPKGQFYLLCASHKLIASRDDVVGLAKVLQKKNVIRINRLKGDAKVVVLFDLL